MTAHEVARSMPAPPDQVFQVATDPSLAGRWLPASIGDTSLRTDGVRVDAGARRIEFGAEGGLRGWLEVRPEPSGGSDVVFHAEGAESDAAPAELGDALLRLANEVGGSSG